MRNNTAWKTKTVGLYEKKTTLRDARSRKPLRNRPHRISFLPIHSNSAKPVTINSSGICTDCLGARA